MTVFQEFRIASQLVALYREQGNAEGERVERVRFQALLRLWQQGQGDADVSGFPLPAPFVIPRGTGPSSVAARAAHAEAVAVALARVSGDAKAEVAARERLAAASATFLAVGAREDRPGFLGFALPNFLAALGGNAAKLALVGVLVVVAVAWGPTLLRKASPS